jgi:hypothetical protein
LDSSIKACTEAIALSESCVLTCVPGVYPENSPEQSTAVMTVVSSIALSGVTVAEFKAVEEEFKLALASTLSCFVDKINITNVTEGSSDQRFLSEKASRVSQRQLKKGGTFLNVEFEVAVSSIDDLRSTTSTLQGKVH